MTIQSRYARPRSAITGTLPEADISTGSGLGRAMRTLAYLALLQNFVRIQALKMALIGATIIMLTEGSSMAATITVHARYETHRYDGRRPMIKLVVTALVAAIMVTALALAAHAQTGTVPLPPIELDQPYTGRLIIHTFRQHG